MRSDMMLAVMQLAAERDLPQDSVITVVEDAIAAAYKRDASASGQDVAVTIDPGNGEVTINTIVHVVDVVDEDGPIGQVTVGEAKELHRNGEINIGDTVVTGELEFRPQRIASRASSQFLRQGLRNAERRIVFEQFVDKEGEVISAPIRRVDSPRDEIEESERGTVVVDLGKADAYLPVEEQPPNERYRTATEMKFFVLKVSDLNDEEEDRPEIIVSRTHPNLLRRLIENEVPEIKTGLVEIREIARAPGSRSKVAVHSNRRDVDPIGACVGLRGIRVQNVVTELMGEKIDILEWSDDLATFITNALSPASVDHVIPLEEGSVEVVVPDSALPLAIGKDGQNVDLAVRLTRTRIDIKGASAYAEEQLVLQQQQAAEEAARAAEEAKNATEAEAEAELAATAEAAAQNGAVELETETETEVGATAEVAAAEAVEQAAEVADEVAADAEPQEEAEAPVAEAEEEAVVARKAPTIFTPDSALAQRPLKPEPDSEEQSAEELDEELHQLEEQLAELEREEKERQAVEREEKQAADLEQFIASGEIWSVPGEAEEEDETASSGLKFAEDIAGFRDSDSDRQSRRGGGRRGGSQHGRR